MRKDKNCIINPAIIAAIAAIRHTEYLVICDPGLPVSPNAVVIDISLTAGVPGFGQTLNLICNEMVVESAIIASETAEQNPKLHEEINRLIGGKTVQQVPHEELKRLTNTAKYFVITGETTPYSNIILVGGVSF